MRDTVSVTRLFVIAAAALGGCICAASASGADSASRARTSSFYGDPAVPDISGLWVGTYSGPPGDRPQTPTTDPYITRWAPWPPPLTPAYQKLADERIAAAKEGRAIGDDGARCYPLGLVRAITSKVYPDEIIQTPGAVSILIFGRGTVAIWTDGRPHPTNLEPSYKGHSIGHWEGDTLHVDSIGIIAAPIDAGPRTPHSARLHMKWTMQRVAPDTLHVHVTLYDEDALTEPMVTTNIWRRKSGPAWEVLDDQSCFENNRNEPDAAGAPGVKKF
jgi:hypothetical protein